MTNIIFINEETIHISAARINHLSPKQPGHLLVPGIRLVFPQRQTTDRHSDPTFLVGQDLPSRRLLLWLEFMDGGMQRETGG